MPRLDYSGALCVEFYYHMYGYHVRSLRLVQRTSDVNRTVWMRSRQMGTAWHHANTQLDYSPDTQV